MEAIIDCGVGAVLERATPPPLDGTRCGVGVSGGARASERLEKSEPAEKADASERRGMRERQPAHHAWCIPRGAAGDLSDALQASAEAWKPLHSAFMT